MSGRDMLMPGTSLSRPVNSHIVSYIVVSNLLFFFRTHEAFEQFTSLGIAGGGSITS